MPCSDYNDTDTIHEMSGQIKELTKIACELANLLEQVEEFKGWPSISKETQDWVRKHKREDRTRLAREARESYERKERKRILSGLTTEEKRILGVR